MSRSRQVTVTASILLVACLAGCQSQPEAPAPRSDKVVSLMDVLQRSLEESKKRRTGAESEAEEEHRTKRPTRRKKSAA